MADLDRNIVVRLNVLNLANAHVSTKIGTTAKRTEAAQNMLLFPMITGFQLTVSVFHSRKFTS